MPAFRKVKKKKGAGPPSIEITDELIEGICNAMRIGAYIETAVVVNGVAKETFYHWCKIAHGTKKKELSDGTKVEYTEEEKAPYLKLLRAVEKATEECIVRDLYNIDKCAMGQDWEYERYPADVVDQSTGELIHRKGELVMNARGNPIPKKVGLAPDWSASAWRLERRHAGKWARLEKVEQTGKDGGPQIVVTIPSNGREVKK